MDVIVTGRRCSVPEPTRDQVTERLSEVVGKLKDRAIRGEVEFATNPAKGDPDQAVRCEITVRGKGPVVRSSAQAQEKMQAFELALDKLKGQLRRAADRRKHHRGLRGASLDAWVADLPASEQVDQVETDQITELAPGLQVAGDGPLVVREKTFTAAPLTLAQALDEMELVGHDFFLYLDATTGAPSVVYRRHAYDYGVIHLQVDSQSSDQPATASAAGNPASAGSTQ